MMSLAQLQSFLAWGALLNYAVLLLVFGAWVMAGDAICRLHSRWFPMERAQCHAAIYLMLGLYKLAVWMLFIIPWIALWIVRHQGGTP